MKDKKWAQREVDRYLSYEGVDEAKNALVFAKGVINQLDEPEVLSQEWIDRFEQFRAYVQEQRDLSYGVELGATGGYTGRIANQYDGLLEMIEEFEEHNPIALQNLLVPTLSEMETDERTQLETAYKDILERGEFWFDDKEYKVIPKQELPVIPKFVADYIEECKRFDESGRKTLYTAMDSKPKDVSEWMTSDVEGFGKGQELFARAWLDGYEVEKEPLYYVTNEANELMLIKKDGVISTVLIPFEFSVDTEYLKLHQLTESEIKDYDERYVQFMKPTEVAE